MSEERRFSTRSGAFNTNSWEQTSESGHYHRHTNDIEFPQNNSSGIPPLFPNLVNFRSEYDSNIRYFEEPRRIDNQTYNWSGMPPYRNIEDCSPLPKRMRQNNCEYFRYSENNLVPPYQSNMPTNYHYLPEYGTNANVSNGYHIFESGSFNNLNSDYHHNNLREDINRSREIMQRSPFASKNEAYTSSRPSLSSNHRDVHLHRESVNSRKRQTERSRKWRLRRSSLETNDRKRSHKRPNLSYTTSPKSIKLKKRQNSVSRRTSRQRSSKLKKNKESDTKAIKKTENEFNGNSENQIAADENKKFEIKEEKKECELVCPHCNLKYFSSASYKAHLNSSKHLKFLNQIVSKLHSKLAKIRLDQRQQQDVLEESRDDTESVTKFCPTCKLNYQQSEAVHEASKYHKKIKNFVSQYCKICKRDFTSLLAYENHICSLSHLRKKAHPDANITIVGDKESSSEKTNIIDKENGKTNDVVTDNSKKELKIVGKEKISKVEAHYCELCKIYLPQVDESRLESAIYAHCSKQTHLKNYYKSDSNKLSNSNEVLAKRKDIKKEENPNESKVVVKENKCVDISHYNNELVPNEETSLAKKIILEKDEKKEKNLNSLNNFENGITHTVDKPNIQEHVDVKNQDEHYIMQNISSSKCIDNKQWVKHVNQDITDYLDSSADLEAEEDKNESTELEDDEIDVFSLCM